MERNVKTVEPPVDPIVLQIVEGTLASVEAEVVQGGVAHPLLTEDLAAASTPFCSTLRLTARTELSPRGRAAIIVSSEIGMVNTDPRL